MAGGDRLPVCGCTCTLVHPRRVANVIGQKKPLAGNRNFPCLGAQPIHNRHVGAHASDTSSPPPKRRAGHGSAASPLPQPARGNRRAHGPSCDTPRFSRRGEAPPGARAVTHLAATAPGPLLRSSAPPIVRHFRCAALGRHWPAALSLPPRGDGRAAVGAVGAGRARCHGGAAGRGLRCPRAAPRRAGGRGPGEPRVCL